MTLVPPDPETAEGYCTPDDVTDFFDKYDEFKDPETNQEGDVIEDGTNPTKSQVESRILAASNKIDDYIGHAFRPRQIRDEYHNFGNTYYWRSGMPIFLNKRDIRTPLDPEEGDKLEIWRGNEYNDWVADDSKTEGRDGDYWVNESEGILYIYRRKLFFRRHKEVRLTYRFGKETVPQTVRDACARLVAVHYLESQQYRVTTPGNEEAPDGHAVAEQWREIAESDLDPYKEIRSSGL